MAEPAERPVTEAAVDAPRAAADTSAAAAVVDIPAEAVVVTLVEVAEATPVGAGITKVFSPSTTRF